MSYIHKHRVCLFLILISSSGLPSLQNCRNSCNQLAEVLVSLHFHQLWLLSPLQLSVWWVPLICISWNISKNVLRIFSYLLSIWIFSLVIWTVFMIFPFFWLFFFLNNQFCRYSLCIRGINPSLIKFVELMRIIVASITNEPPNLGPLIWWKIISCSSNSPVWAFLVCRWAAFFQLVFQGLGFLPSYGFSIHHGFGVLCM